MKNIIVHLIFTFLSTPSAKQYPYTGPGCYELRGKVVEEYDFVSIEVSYMKRLGTVDREAMDKDLNVVGLV